MRIYEIPLLYRNVLDSMEIDEETGEILNTEVIRNFEMDAAEKIENTGLYVREQDHEVKALKEEAARMLSRAKAIETRCARLKALMLEALKPFNGKIKGTRLTVFERRTPVVLIKDGIELPPAFTTIKTTITPNKILIKNALKDGTEIPGCTLGESISVMMR